MLKTYQTDMANIVRIPVYASADRDQARERVAEEYPEAVNHPDFYKLKWALEEVALTLVLDLDTMEYTIECAD